MTNRPGALSGLRIVELVSVEATAPVGKWFGDLGANVIVVEPPEGSPLRKLPPFADDVLGANRSLRWWSDATSKKSVVLDLADDPRDTDRLKHLIANADIVIEAETTSRLAKLGIHPEAQLELHPRLIWLTVSPFDRHGSRADEPSTDLTLMAGGGPVWSCGYDDHNLSPVRGQGHQSYAMGAVFAVIAALAAVAYRRRTGQGQLVEVDINAACNVTTEQGSHNWLVAQTEVQRQTGRHAGVTVTYPVQVLCRDGKYATTGVLPRTRQQFQALVNWLEDLNLMESLSEGFFLKMAAEGDTAPDNSERDADPVAQATFGVARDALFAIARSLTAQEFFVEGQRRGLAVAAIYSPDEAFENEHFVARGSRQVVLHEDLDREIIYPGAPFKMSETPYAIRRRPPLLGEHSEEMLNQLS